MVRRYVWDEEGYPPDGMELVAAADYDAAQTRILDLESELRLAITARDYANDMLDKERARIRELEAQTQTRSGVVTNTPNPLDDHEQAFLYEVCRYHSERAYSLVRRLTRWGVIQDPPYPDGPAVPTPNPEVKS